MHTLNWRLCGVAACLLIVMAPALQAQTARSGGGASAQLLQQLQQLATERTAMQAENAKLKKDLDDMRKERDVLKNAQKAGDARAKAAAAELAAVTAQRASTDQELKQNREKTEQLIAKFRETIQTLRETEADRTTAKETLATRDSELKVCIDRNLALYNLNDEVLTHFADQSVWSRLATAEPFTRLKRTQLENLIDGYRDRAQDQRVTAESVKLAAQRQAPARPAAPTAPTAAPPAPGSSPAAQPQQSH